MKRSILVVVVILSVANIVSADTFYEIVDIGILPGSSRSEASAINNNGQVVGHCYLGRQQAFLWENGNLIALEGLGNTTKTGFASDINDHGDIVGGSYPPGTSRLNAYLYHDGITENLGTLGGYWSSARAINNNGEIAGASELRGINYKHAFSYTNGEMKLITEADQLGYVSDAMGINDNGAIVGLFRHQSAGLPYQAFVYQDGVAMPLFGPDGEMLTYAYDINNSGQVVGRAHNGAFIWENGQASYLGSSSSSAKAINEAGHIVGADIFENEGNAALFIDGVIYNLNDLLVPLETGKWILSIASDINDSGQIVGKGINPDGLTSAFLLTPLPEPSVPPVADANGPYTLYAGDTLTLDASGSTDDANDITSYVWDLDDDGVFETDAGTEAIVDVSYAYLESLGLGIGVDYNIHLKVTDGDERGDTDTTTLTIEPKPALVIAVDIKPQSCPNPLNVKSKGVLPVAIPGSETVDVYDIDIDSIQLAGVSPIRSNYEDVATGLVDPIECECSTEGPDGYIDLTLKFEIQAIADALGEAYDGEEFILYLTGYLYDGTPIEGSDCIIVRRKGRR